MILHDRCQMFCRLHFFSQYLKINSFLKWKLNSLSHLNCNNTYDRGAEKLLLSWCACNCLLETNRTAGWLCISVMFELFGLRLSLAPWRMVYAVSARPEWVAHKSAADDHIAVASTHLLWCVIAWRSLTIMPPSIILPIIQISLI